MARFQQGTESPEHMHRLNLKTTSTALPAVFPFSALVGQEEMRKALLLTAVDPSLGGVLILGERGTAKSTAARGLANVWPGQGKFVTLPLGATEDRVVGGLDFEKAITSGKVKPEPGLLAKADQGVLYLDEINLLDEHLAALILDAASSGWVFLEREGVSWSYPSEFALIGTMNPEEGQLSPQLLDRFGLAVQVKAEPDPALRQELIRRRLRFEADPRDFAIEWENKERSLALGLKQARDGLDRVKVGPRMRNLAGRLAAEAGAAGQRAELSMIKAARALAALEGAEAIQWEHLREVAGMALLHRRRQMADPGKQTRKSRPGKHYPAEQQELEKPPQVSEPEARQERGTPSPVDGEAQGQEKIHGVNSPFALSSVDPGRHGGWLISSGRRLKRETKDGSGRYIRASMERLGREIALDATFRAAAPFQNQRDRSVLNLVIHSSDIREKIKVKTTGRLVVFVVDGSGSMGSLLRMQEAKAAILSLLAEAYQKRDRVGMVSFRGYEAELLLPPTNSVELANRCLEELPTGGKTPLAHGLIKAAQVVMTELRRDPKLNPLIVLLSDGKPNIPFVIGAEPWDEVMGLTSQLRLPGLTWLVVDTDWGHYLSFGMCRQLAEQLNGTYIKLDELRSQGLVKLVNQGFQKRS